MIFAPVDSGSRNWPCLPPAGDMLLSAVAALRTPSDAGRIFSASVSSAANFGSLADRRTWRVLRASWRRSWNREGFGAGEHRSGGRVGLDIVLEVHDAVLARRERPARQDGARVRTLWATGRRHPALEEESCHVGGPTHDGDSPL